MDDARTLEERRGVFRVAERLFRLEPVDRCAFFAFLLAAFSAWPIYVNWRLLQHPEGASFLWPSSGFFGFTLAYLTSLLAIATVALAVRRSSRNPRWLIGIFLQVCFVFWGISVYLVGPFTTDFLGAVGISGVAVGTIFFERRLMRLGLITFISIVCATTAAQILGLVPYAPAFSASPAADGRIASEFVSGFGGTVFLIAIVSLVLVYSVIAEWHEQDRRLRRANDLIRRYVPGAVADRALKGKPGAELSSERRRVTIFFSDVAGFTEMADRLEPEDFHQLVNDYLGAMSASANEFGGVLAQIAGDALMVILGAPDPMPVEAQARHAVDMALAMQARTAKLRAEWRRRGIDAPVRVRMGIHTGVANVGNFGSPGHLIYTAHGTQVNVAARLEATSAPDEILISAATHALVEDIPCTPRGEVQVKGVHYPIEVFRVQTRDEGAPL